MRVYAKEKPNTKVKKENNVFLEIDAKTEIVVETIGELPSPSSIVVTTAYARYESILEKSVTGVSERWMRLETRPSFEVGLLRWEDFVPLITLMRKRRKAGETPRAKVPGGYLRGSIETYGAEKVRADTGRTFVYADLLELPTVVGHPEIITPIRLFYTFQWEIVGRPRDGVEVFEVPLDAAVQMGWESKIENDSSLSVIMWLSHLVHTGKIARGD